MDNFGRKKFDYVATLQDAQGNMMEYPISTYWSPTAEGIMDQVGAAAAIEATRQHGREFMPVAVVYKEA